MNKNKNQPSSAVNEPPSDVTTEMATVKASSEVLAFQFTTAGDTAGAWIANGSESDVSNYELSVEEQNDLRNLELTVKAGLDTFVLVGQALYEIKHRRLYRNEFKNFETYCWKKWSISRQHAYKLIDAGQITEAMSTRGDKVLPQNAKQACALKDVPVDKRGDVMEKAKAQAKGRKVTAKGIEVAKAELLGRGDMRPQVVDEGYAEDEASAVADDAESRSESEQESEGTEGERSEQDEEGESDGASKIIDFTADLEVSEPEATLFEVVEKLDEFRSYLPTDRISDEAWELFDEIRADIQARAFREEQQQRSKVA